MEWNECYLLADFPVLSAIFYNLPYGGKDNAVSDAIINPNGYVAIPLDSLARSVFAQKSIFDEFMNKPNPEHCCFNG